MPTPRPFTRLPVSDVPSAASAVSDIYDKLAVLARPFSDVQTQIQTIDRTVTVIRETTATGDSAPSTQTTIPAKSIEGATGQALDPQNSFLPALDTLPAIGGAYDRDGLLIELTGGTGIPGTLYRFDGPSLAWVGPILGGILYDTHANRTLYAAAIYTGAQLVETDRQALYYSNGTSWILVKATGYGTHAARWSDLGANDVGAIYIESDRKYVYRWSGTAWIYVSGSSSGTFETRWSDLGANDTGAIYIETSRSTVASYTPPPTFRWSGTAWVYVSGAFSRIRADVATLAATLASGAANRDIGVLVYVSDYIHQLIWTAGGWDWGPDDSRDAGQGPVMFEITPGSGWAVYDGSTVTYLKSDGTTGSVALPDLTSAANKAAYAKLGNPASGPNAAVAPGALGSGANTGDATTGITNPAATGSNTTGVTVNANTSNSNPLNGTGIPLVIPNSNHAHGVTDPGHTHTIAAPTDPGHHHTLSGVTITVDAIGEPRNLVRLPWFRK